MGARHRAVGLVVTPRSSVGRHTELRTCILEALGLMHVEDLSFSRRASSTVRWTWTTAASSFLMRQGGGTRWP